MRGNAELAARGFASGALLHLGARCSAECRKKIQLTNGKKAALVCKKTQLLTGKQRSLNRGKTHGRFADMAGLFRLPILDRESDKQKMLGLN